MKKPFYFLFFILACFFLPIPASVMAAENMTKPLDKDQPITYSQLEKHPKIIEIIQKIVHNYIVNHPQVLVEAEKKLREIEGEKEKERIEQIRTNIAKYKNQIFDSKLPGRVVLGNPQGKIIITEFTQYQCSSCKLVFPIINNLLKTNQDVQLIVVYWPFLGNDAAYTAKALLAAQKQNKFAELEKAILDSSAAVTKSKVDEYIKLIPAIDSKKLYADMNNKEFDTGLKDNFKLAQNLNIIGTPTFIFANKNMKKISFIPGQTSHFEEDLSQALKAVQ